MVLVLLRGKEISKGEGPEERRELAYRDGSRGRRDRAHLLEVTVTEAKGGGSEVAVAQRMK